MLHKLRSDTMPHLAFLYYDRRAPEAVDLILVPSHFVTLRAIERRPPLSPTARRAGWVGCNILLSEVPPDGRLIVVAARAVTRPTLVRAQWQRFAWMRDEDVTARGWAADVLHSLRSMGRREFTLTDAYGWEAGLADRYPRNRNVRAKIRQQLQVLRDKGILRFIGGGRYQVLE